MPFMIPAPAPATLPVEGGGLFPVRRVYCVARNYADHAREMGDDPSREPPCFFTKPADAVGHWDRIAYPPQTRQLDHEVEMVAVLGAGGRNIPAERALDCVFGYAVGLDLTRRDVQEGLKALRRPWDMAKGFDQSGPMGLIQPAARIGHPVRGAITVAVNGEIRQHGDLVQMSWDTAGIIAQLSREVELKAGDVIFTGTPAGVGPIPRGARLDCHLDGVGSYSVVVD